MKKLNFKYSISFIALVILLLASCSRDLEELELATFPADPLIFIDGFSAGLEYSAFGGSDVTAFDVDREVKYKGSASMRFAVPSFEDPAGAYAGGAFVVPSGRDLSGFDALTFWAKASQPANVDLIGYGNDLGERKYQASISNVPMTTNWKKYYIPIADASKLTQEEGMLFFSEGHEDGEGYTFWLDEVQFEKLGTIAHPKPAILETQDQNISVETGDKPSIGGTFATFNIPTGVDQRVDLSPHYFTFSSSNESVATVSSGGVATVLDAGTTIITAKIGEVDAAGSLTLVSTGAAVRPPNTAPAPTRSQDSVISMFSNVYEDVVVDTWNPFWEFSTAEVTDIKIGDDDVKRYKSLNFVGILTESAQIDASAMTHFHLDIWTPNSTEAPASFKVLLVDFGPDQNFGGGDDSSHELSFTSPLLMTEEWVSIDVPLSTFAGLSRRSNIAQLVLSGDLSTVFVDNVYYYNGGAVQSSGPEVSAPAPTRNAADVVSIYSDAYTSVGGTDFNPDWGQATAVSEVSINGDNALLYAGLNYQGTQLDPALDVSGMTHVHLDYWTANSSMLNFFSISPGPIETGVSLAVPSDGWNSVDIPLGDFSPVDFMNLIQFKFDGNGDIYLDNLYFYEDDGGGSETEPSSPAPDPTIDAADVISIFSDAYTNVEGTNLNPDWGQATVVSEVDINGNNTLMYAGLNYQGMELGSPQDASGMTHLHMDIWTANSSALNAFLISSGPVETAYAVAVPTSGWLSLDIPLSSFDPVDLADIIQFKFDGNGDIYLDNIFFYSGDGGGGPTEPDGPAPDPTNDAGDVISIFSDAYENVAESNLNPDWGQATVVSEVSIDGNNTLLYTGLNYQGLELGSNQNASEMTHLHIDFWTANSTALKIFLISPGPVETPVELAVPTSGWVSLDIELSNFSPVDLADVFQFKFEGDGDIYIDNLFFFK